MSGIAISCDISKAAEMIGIGRTKFYELVNSGEIPTFKIGSRRLVACKDLQVFVEAAALSADPAAASAVSRGPKNG